MRRGETGERDNRAWKERGMGIERGFRCQSTKFKNSAVIKDFPAKMEKLGSALILVSPLPR